MNAEEALVFFEENKEKHDIIRPYISLKTLIHISPERRTPILEQIERARNQIGKITRMWPKFEERNKLSDEANALFNVINLGLTNNEKINEITELLLYFVSIPSFRFFVQPLMEETNFLIHIPDDDNRISLFYYYFSFKYRFDAGVLTYKESVKEYNDILIKFQAAATRIDASNKLGIATINELQSEQFVADVLSETSDDFMQQLMHEFAIPIEEDKETNIRSIINFLLYPIDPKSRIPDHILPTRRGPPDVLYPHFTRYALSLTDATTQVFLEKRYELANEIMTFLEEVCNNLNPNNEVRFDPRAIPLLSLPHSSSMNGARDVIQCSFVLDPTFLQWDAKSFEEGEPVYLININESFENGNFIGVKCIGCIVTSMPREDLVTAKVDSNEPPSANYNVLVKLPTHIMRNCQRLLKLPEAIGVEDVPKKVTDSLIGFTNQEGPGITLIDTPLGTSGCLDAAKWIAENYKQGDKTYIIAPSSVALDELVTRIYEIKLLMPSMYIMRLDLPTQVCHQVAVKSRDRILDELKKNGIDEVYCQSCLMAINYLKTLNEPSLSLVIKQLEDLRPIEYLGNIEKAVSYLKKDVAQIICQLTTQKLQLKDAKIKNLIIIDSCHFEESDLISTIATLKPENVRVYSPKNTDSLAAYHVSTAMSRMWPKEGEQITFNLESSSEIRMKNESICRFIQSHVSNATAPHTLQTPCVINPCHFFKTNSPKESLHVTIATAFFFRLLGFNAKRILIVVPNDEGKALALKIMKKRAAWDSEELMMKSQIVTISSLINESLEGDVICFDASFMPSDCEKETLLILAQLSKYAFMVSGTEYNEEWKLDTSPLKVCFNERFVGKPLESNDREYFEIENHIHFLQLVLHMQNQRYARKSQN